MTVLIATLGESPGVVTEAIDLLQNQGIVPEKVILIHTSDSTIQEASNFLRTHIQGSYGHQISVESIAIKDHVDVLTDEAINELVKEAKRVFEFHRSDDIYVCISGGRKSMSTILAILAQVYNAREVFHIVAPEDVEKNWSEIRHLDEKNMKKYLHPGINDLKFAFLPFERLTSLWIQEKKADELFNRGRYSEASGLYLELSRRLENPREMEIKHLIAEAYHNWENFVFEEANRKIKEAIGKIEEFEKLLDKKERLKEQEQILEILITDKDYLQAITSDEYFENIALFFFSKAERQAENRIYDFGILSLYRILELISQHRLAKLGINTDGVNEEVRARYNEPFKRMRKKILNTESEIPEKIGLFDGWLLLTVMGDELFNDKGIEDKLKRLSKGILPNRNKLWIEYGNDIGSERKFEAIKEYTAKWLKKLITDFDKKINKFCFIKF